MKGRVKFFLFLLRACLPFLLVITGPTFFQCCTKDCAKDFPDIRTDLIINASTGDGTKVSETHTIGSVDIFIFNADGEETLDSYQRIEDFSNIQYCTATSKAGDKRAVIIANCPAEKLRFTELSCYADLAGVVYELEEEVLDKPVMSGEQCFTAGTDSGCTINLSALVCEIRIDRISCDRVVENVRVGLRNICTRTTIINPEASRPTGFESEGPKNIYYSGIVLKCYPNSGEGGLGTPPTELVIQWTENGVIQEFSTKINGETGIERNSCYYFEINL